MVQEDSCPRNNWDTAAVWREVTAREKQVPSPGETETVQDFLLLFSITNHKGDGNQEIGRGLGLGRVAMEELEEIVQCKAVLLTTKNKITHAIVFLYYTGA